MKRAVAALGQSRLRPVASGGLPGQKHAESLAKCCHIVYNSAHNDLVQDEFRALCPSIVTHDGRYARIARAVLYFLDLPPGVAG